MQFFFARIKESPHICPAKDQISFSENYKFRLMKRTKVAFDQEKLQYSSELLRALAHPLRLQILEFIDRHKEINVNKIYHALKIEQSITSQHLKVLRMAGIVDYDKDGKFIHYRIDYERLQKTAAALENFRQTDELLKKRAVH